jgi:protein TonB
MKITSLISRVGVMLLCCISVTLRGADSPSAGKNGYTVTVEVRVDETGKVRDAAVIDSQDVSAGEVLAKMALAMALNMEVPPHMKNGKAVPATFHAPFFFGIEDDEGPDAARLPRPRPKQATAVMPAYPPALRDQGVVGGAIMELRIDDQGKLTHMSTLRASHPEFEAAAKEALSRWEFGPAQKDGKPVESRSRIAMVFETEAAMADLKWRIAPRPSLGSFIVIRTDTPIDESEVEQPVSGTEPPAAPATAESPAR